MEFINEGNVKGVDMMYKYGANIRKHDDFPLHRAYMLRQPEVMEYLMDKGANPMVLDNLDLFFDPEKVLEETSPDID